MGMKSRKKQPKTAGRKKTAKSKPRKAKTKAKARVRGKVKPGAKRSSKVRRTRVRPKRARAPQLEELFPMISVAEESSSSAPAKAIVNELPFASPPTAPPAKSPVIKGCTCSYRDGSSESERAIDLFCPIHKSLA